MEKFDEYKFFADSTQYLSDRRQNATQMLLGVNSAIFAVLGFMMKDIGALGGDLLLVSAPLFVVGVLACLIWYGMLTQYKALISWRFDQLISMEESMPDSYRMYTKEWKDFYEPRQGRDIFGFSRIEVWLPRLFGVLYAIYAVALVTAVLLGWQN